MNLAPLLRPAVASIAAVGTLAVASPALATTCVDLCGAGSGPCTLSGTINVTPGSVLNCAGRNITINGDVRVDDGALTLRVQDLLVNNGGQLRARRISGTDEIGLTVEADGYVTVNGKIDTSAPGRAGSISIRVDGNFQTSNYSNGGVRARGEQSGGDGGNIAIDIGGSANIWGPIYANGSSQGETFGGEITIDAVGDVTSGLAGKIDATSHLGQAGSISISTQGSLAIGALLTTEATGQDGYGGDVSLIAANAITLSSDISAAGGAGVASSLGVGGDVDVSAGCGGIAVNATVNATNGGSIDLDADGQVSVGGSGLLRADAQNSGGSGGDISIVSRSTAGNVTTAAGAALQAFGNGAGTGGRIEISGCNIDLSSSSLVDAHGGKGGIVQLLTSTRGASGGSLHVASGAQTKAAGASPPGQIRLVLRDQKSGVCSNDPARSCTYDANCTVGCNTGTCNGENPNTDNVLTQFDTNPTVLEDASLPECTAVCGGGQ